MAEVRLEPLPFAEAIEFFRQKGYALSPNSWRDVWAEAHAKAFTVAKVASMDLLQDIRAMVDEALAKGVSLDDFKQNFLESLSRKGWAGAKPWRAEVIYRTNLQSAYNTGRYRQMLEIAHRRPYWMYSAVLDSRVRPSHAALHGVIRRFDDPFWQRFYPPNGFNCRCTVRTLSEKDLQRRGLRVTEKLPAGVEPDEGFDYNPGQAAWEPDLSKYGPEAIERLEREAVGVANTIPALSQALTRYKNAIGQTGIKTISSDITVDVMSKEEIQQYPDARGLFYRRNGRLALREDLYAKLRRDITGKAVSPTAEEWGTLVHEFGHSLGTRAELGVNNEVLRETINEIWSIIEVPRIVKVLGFQSPSVTIDDLLAHTGYASFVKRLLEIFEAAGFRGGDLRIIVSAAKYAADENEMANVLWDAILSKAPNVEALKRVHWGEILQSRFLTDALISEIKHSLGYGGNG